MSGKQLTNNSSCLRSTANQFDVIIIGGGHAGCEAALAAARMNCKTLLLTISLQKIALMPCNPSIGGIGKGHLVREIDALGGEMAKVADKAAIQIRTLNSSKGPAVRALRAQIDKKVYEKEMRKILVGQTNLVVREGLVGEILITNNKIRGVMTVTGHVYEAGTVIVASGTFMRGRLVIGDIDFEGGRMGEMPALSISKSLQKIGLQIKRFQSATPPRIDSRSIDYSKMIKQPEDSDNLNFSIDNHQKIMNQIPSYITRTNRKTQAVVKKYLKYSPIKSGSLKSHGPRYCPSIDRKIINFPNKDSHPVFVEPEGRMTQEMYLQGLTTAMPASLQQEIIRTVEGLEDAEIMRPGYAVEYDYVLPRQLTLSLETKDIEGLFFAGQVIGTTGYEEAAALGLVAGINAALKAKREPSFALDRSQAYIGVLIDDLVTKGVDEPYRMFTSRAEYRLLLRCDNADFRLRPIASKLGLTTKDNYDKSLKKHKRVEKFIGELKRCKIRPEQINKHLKRSGGGQIKQNTTAYNLLRRPAMRLSMLDAAFVRSAPQDIKEMAEVRIKYEGYINKQTEEINRFKRLEHLKISPSFDYAKIKALSFEAREKLSKVQPTSLGQASRVPGITPADISVLHISLRGN